MQSTTMKTTYNINEIQTLARQAGSRWFDRNAMKMFGTKLQNETYCGDGGVYFVTQDKDFEGKRKWSVRTFKPSDNGIDTVGDVASMTQKQAVKMAVESAGANMVTTNVEPYIPTNTEQLVIDIKRGGGACDMKQAAKLISLAKKHHKAMEDECNFANQYDDDGEPIPSLKKLVEDMQATAGECGCGAIISGDPRGCTFVLKLPNGDTNDWGKKGWTVPTEA